MLKKRTIIIWGIILVVFMIGILYLGKSKETPMKAVYLKDEDENSIFVELDTEMVFEGHIPQELYNEKKKKITEKDLNSGDIVKIWGNGMILESYPAQYPGIIKMQREEKENQEYIEKYGHYLGELYNPSSKTESPYLNIFYKQSQALVTVATDIVTDVSALKFPELIEVSVEKDTLTELLFSIQPENVEIVRWRAEQKMEEFDASSIPEGETVAAEKNKEDNWVISIQAGYIYQVKGIWENQEIEYGFSVIPVKK